MNTVEDPRTTPWHPDHIPSRSRPGWVKRCREWCERLRERRSGRLRTDLCCEACGFRFRFQTENGHWSREFVGGEDPNFYEYGVCCNPDCKRSWRDYIQKEWNREVTPWHPDNCPADVADREAWSARCRAWCEAVNVNEPAQSLRTHLRCKKCGFGFLVRTSNYSLRTSADVYNYSTCCNPDCRATETEVS